jgi:hypothetical protein
MAPGYHSDYKRQELAFHEAGHIVVATVEGFRPEGLTVFIKSGGEAEITLACTERSAEEYAESRLRVLLAGAVSQCMRLSPGDPACTCEAFGPQREGWSDYSKALELVWLLRNTRPGATVDPETAKAEADAVLSKCLNDSAAILERNWEAVTRLADSVIAGLSAIASAGPDDLDAPDRVRLERSEILDLMGDVG